MKKATNVTTLLNERPPLVCEMNEIREHLNRYKNQTPRFLEVGCGRRSPVGSFLHENRYKFHLDGLDIDPVGCGLFVELEYTNEAVVGDAAQMPFKDGAYDVLVSHFVLEHLMDSRKALKDMSRVVTNNGLLILIFPNPTSPDSIVTRLTPHEFHVFFRGVIQNLPEAGERTFPTFFSFVSVENVVRWLRQNGFSEVKAVYFADTYHRFRARRVVGKLTALYCRILTRLGLKRLMSTAVVVARK
jgi:ubiquinone/menaquinone biosynthesis C-methylase UbiE